MVAPKLARAQGHKSGPRPGHGIGTHPNCQIVWLWEKFAQKKFEKNFWKKISKKILKKIFKKNFEKKI